MITFTPYTSGSSGNLYTVTDGQTTIMLDCGIPWPKIREALKFKTSEIAGVLITHGHLDHAKGCKDASKNGLDIYASSGTFERLQGISEHRKNVIEPDRVFKIGTWRIRPFSTVHDAEGSLAFYMVNQEGEAFLYLTDSAYSPVRFANLRVIAIECNFVDQILVENVIEHNLPAVVARRVRRNHMSLEQLTALLKANDLSRLKELWLLHLSRGNSDEKQMIERVQQEIGVPVYACEE